jgi:hypothetical protein
MKCLFESVECEHRNTGGCSRGDCVFAPQDNAESPSHSLQQLKAEILPLLTDALDEFADRKFDRGEYYLKQAMAKLSAV